MRAVSARLVRIISINQVNSLELLPVPQSSLVVRVVMSAHDHADSLPLEAASAKMDSPSPNGDSHDRSAPRSPIKEEPDEASTMKPDPEKETVGGDIVLKQEPGQPPKLSRSSSQKVVPRPPQLWAHLPDSTDDALATFEQMELCWYANKYMGYTEHAMECDCAEEWGKSVLHTCAVIPAPCALMARRRGINKVPEDDAHDNL